MAVEMDVITQRLRAAGLRLTGPRRRLLDLFAGLGRWCTPQELHAQAASAGVPAGLATVYRLVEALVEAGLCKPFVRQDRSVRYVFCAPGHHHHLICEDCGAVAELRDCHLALPATDFAITDHSLDFFGRCTRCQDRAPA